MKKLLVCAAFLLSFCLHAIEYEVQLENNQVQVARVKIMPYEEIGLHRDEYPGVILALQGGVITRLEANGTKTDVSFPTGIAVFRDADPSNELHKSVNQSANPVELIIIQLRNSLPHSE